MDMACSVPSHPIICTLTCAFLFKHDICLIVPPPPTQSQYFSLSPTRTRCRLSTQIADDTIIRNSSRSLQCHSRNSLLLPGKATLGFMRSDEQSHIAQPSPPAWRTTSFQEEIQPQHRLLHQRPVHPKLPQLPFPRRLFVSVMDKNHTYSEYYRPRVYATLTTALWWLFCGRQVLSTFTKVSTW